MRTTDDDRRCTRVVDAHPTGPVPLRPGLYQESDIVNYLGEPLWIIDYANRQTVIEPWSYGQMNRHVALTIRAVNGMRSFCQTTGRETTEAPLCRHQVPLEVLREGPIYIARFDVVLALAAHRAIAVHPHSVDYREAMRKQLHEVVARMTAEPPLSVLVNDPSKKLNYIYVAINGRICATRVSHFQGEGEEDTVTVAYREIVVGDKVETRLHQTRLTELRKQEGQVWTFGDLMLSPSREALSLHLEASARRQEASMLTLDEHQRRMELARAHDQERIAEQDKEIQDLGANLRRLKANLGRLSDSDLAEQGADIALRTVEVERLRLLDKAANFEEDRETRQHRMRQEEMSQAQKARTETWNQRNAVVKTAIGVGGLLVAGWKVYQTVTGR